MRALRFVGIVVCLLLVACAEGVSTPPGGSVYVSPIQTETTPASGPAPTDTPSAGGRPTDTPGPKHYAIALPLVQHGYTSTVAPPAGPEIYDCAGNTSDAAWLRSYFGDVRWDSPPGATARLSTLWAACGDQPAVLVAHVADETGAPVENATLVFYWPDAPALDEDLWNCGLERGVVGYTNMNGDVGFGLGPGAFYEPPAGGPHVVWLGGSGDCLEGIGMKLGTNHHHVDSGWVVPAGLAAEMGGRDQLFVPGTVVYHEVIGGREMDVIVWPGWGWER